MNSGITYSAITADDFEICLALRIAAMRESLERIGRFDPERARERLRRLFYPEHSEFILCDGERIGFYTLRPGEDGLYLEHLYIQPSHQSRGMGSRVLRRLLAEADARQLPMRLGALRDSSSNGFYHRHGFVQTSEDEWDIYYIRQPQDPVSFYAPRAIRFLELWQTGRWRIKVYGIAYATHRPSAQLVAAAQHIAAEVLSNVPEHIRHYYIGFLGVHSGQTANFVFVDFWADENELHHHVFVSPKMPPSQFTNVTGTGLSACVWDLRLQAFEREAWIKHVLKQNESPDFERYLTYVLNADV